MHLSWSVCDPRPLDLVIQKIQIFPSVKSENPIGTGFLKITPKLASAEEPKFLTFSSLLLLPHELQNSKVDPFTMTVLKVKCREDLNLKILAAFNDGGANHHPHLQCFSTRGRWMRSQKNDYHHKNSLSQAHSVVLVCLRKLSSAERYSKISCFSFSKKQESRPKIQESSQESN